MNTSVALAVLLAASSGLADALTRNTIKVSKVTPFFFNGVGLMFALPVYVVWLLWVGVPNVDPRFWLAVAVHVPLFVIAITLTVRAHRIGTMANTAPYIALTPAFLLITGPLMGTGTVNVGGGVGVGILVLGMYVLNIRKTDPSIFGPIKNIWKERAPMLMVIVAAIFAVTANLDYYGFKYASAPFYLLVDHGSAAVLCLVAGSIDKKRNPDKYEDGVVRKQIGLLALFGFFLSLSVVPHMLAFKFTDNVAYIIAGKRTGMIIFSVIIALLLAGVPSLKDRFGKETLYFKVAAPGVFLVIVGMLFVIFN